MPPRFGRSLTVFTNQKIFEVDSISLKDGKANMKDTTIAQAEILKMVVRDRPKGFGQGLLLGSLISAFSVIPLVGMEASCWSDDGSRCSEGAYIPVYIGLTAIGWAPIIGAIKGSTQTILFRDSISAPSSSRSEKELKQRRIKKIR
jgi:hypothetical protein